MQSTAKNPKEYIENLPDERKQPYIKIRNIIKENIPE
jgi:hypothetical protein